MPPLPTDRDDDSTADTTTRLRKHLQGALEGAEHRGTRRHLREALQLLAGDDAIDGAAAGGAADVDATPGAGAAEVPTEREAVRAAFTDVPRTDVDDTGRALLPARYPPAVIPDAGPAPDPHATADTPPVHVPAPAWVLATAAYALARHGPVDGRDGSEAERARIRVLDVLDELVDLDVTYVTPGGADAVDAIIEAGASEEMAALVEKTDELVDAVAALREKGGERPDDDTTRESGHGNTEEDRWVG